MKARRFPIAIKIGGAFALLTGLLLAVGLSGYMSTSTSSTGFDEYRSIALNTNLVGRVQANMLSARMETLRFLWNGSDEAVTEYRERMDTTRQLLQDATQSVQDPERAELVRGMVAGAETYDESFTKLIDYRALRDEMLNVTLAKLGKTMEQEMTEILQTAREDGDMEAAYGTAEALRQLLLGRLYVVKFIDTNAEADFERAMTEFRGLDESLVWLHNNIENPERKKLLADIELKEPQYVQAANELHALIVERNTLVSGTMAPIGNKIVSDVEDLKLAYKAEQDEIGPRLVASNHQAVTTILTIAGVATLVAALLATFITLGIVRPVKAMVASLRDIAEGEGDLTARVEAKSRDELGDLANWVNTFIAKVHDIIFEVATATDEVASGATEIAASAEEMAAGIEEQSAQVDQVTTAMEEMSTSVVQVADKARDAATSADESGKVAGNGGEIVQQTIDGMNSISEAVSAGAASVTELGRRGEQIGQIIGVINDIADQTNLLALNAAIEAARAGEHGRGFAVVADEVRKLAERTQQATEEVTSSIKEIQDETGEAVKRMDDGIEQVKAGVDHAEQAGDSLRLIVTNAQDLSQMVASIAAVTEQQSAAAEQVSRNVENIASVSRESAQGASQAASAAAQMSGKAEQLRQIVSQFKLRQAA
jgi:methyl-accepting chemotaxis protein